MKIALIGLGHVARFQIEALAQSQEIVLSDAFDINYETAGILPSNTKFHHSLDAILQESKADLFMVSTPNVTHFEIAYRAIQEGKSVVVEKPICANEVELETLVSEADRRSVFAHVALHASFARDLHWWLDHREEFTANTNNLVGFASGFFDPLITDGDLAKHAASLGGSWFDSGINALSVIAKLVDSKTLRVEESRMTRIPQIPCSQIQGFALLSFMSGSHQRHGFIDTNWTLGLNRKVTRLFYEGFDVVLHHSDEKVLIVRNGQIVREVKLAGSLPRLTNHYTALFQDLHRSYQRKQGNIREAIPLHRLLFTAARGSEQGL